MQAIHQMLKSELLEHLQASRAPVLLHRCVLLPSRQHALSLPYTKTKQPMNTEYGIPQRSRTAKMTFMPAATSAALVTT